MLVGYTLKELIWSVWMPDLIGGVVADSGEEAGDGRVAAHASQRSLSPDLTGNVLPTPQTKLLSTIQWSVPRAITSIHATANGANWQTGECFFLLLFFLRAMKEMPNQSRTA